jgi:hypothetical protein
LFHRQYYRAHPNHDPGRRENACADHFGYDKGGSGNQPERPALFLTHNMGLHSTISLFG